jgi:hypothetical protein
MSIEAISKKIEAKKKEYAKARANAVAMEHNRTVVTCTVQNEVEASAIAGGDKAPSEATLTRLAQDTPQYKEAIVRYADAVKESLTLEAELEALERDFEIEKMKVSV